MYSSSSTNKICDRAKPHVTLNTCYEMIPNSCLSDWVSECVGFNMTGHIRDESFQIIDCNATHNQKPKNTCTWNTIKQTRKLATAKADDRQTIKSAHFLCEIRTKFCYWIYCRKNRIILSVVCHTKIEQFFFAIKSDDLIIRLSLAWHKQTKRLSSCLYSHEMQQLCSYSTNIY